MKLTLNWRRSFRVVRVAVASSMALAAFFSTPAPALDVLGQKPNHVIGRPSPVPNEQAISQMIWAPGIDEGYVPQGLTWADGALYLASYQSTDPKINRGTCRIFKVDPENGKTLGHFDLPKECGHVGGLAHLGNDTLIAADTRSLYRINIAAAFSSEPKDFSKAITAVVHLRGSLKGSFVDSDKDSVFIGSYEKDPAKSKGYFLSKSIFDTHNGKTINEALAARSIALTVASQGAAFDKTDVLWVTASGSRFGSLSLIDGKTGERAASYETVSGIEDIAFDNKGRMWAVSEAGSLRWRKWNKTFPVLFRVEINKLKSSMHK